MTRRPHRKSKNKSPNTILPSSVKKTEDAKHEGEKTANQQESTNQSNQSAESIIPCKQERSTKKDWWDKSSIIFTALMMIVTITLFLQSRQGVKAAVDSTKIADSTFQEVKKQFEIENRPFMILDEVTRNPIEPNTNFVITVTLRNVGKTPALIKSFRYGNDFSVDSAVEQSNWRKSNMNNLFIESGKQVKFPYTGMYIDTVIYKSIVSLFLRAYYYGEIIFYDIVSNKTYSYTYSIRIMPNGTFLPTPINNTFKEISN